MSRLLVCALLAGLLPSAAVAADAEAAPAAEPPFDVWEYRVLGNTLLPATSVEKAVYPHLGPAKHFTDVEAARQSLEFAYRDAGYGTVFVDVPEQDVDRGIVRMRVTEGRIDRIRVAGARYFSNGRIRSAIPSLARGQVPKLGQVQAEVNALNQRSGDRAIVPILKAGRTPGTVDIVLNVEDKLPVHGSLEVNDRRTANTSETRLNASLSYSNLFQKEHSFSLQYQVAPENRDDVEAFVGSYVFRVPRWPDTTFAVYAVDSNTDVAALGTLSVIGNGRIFGLRAIQALEATAGYSSSLTFGLDYKDFVEQIRLEDDDLNTPIRYLNWSLAYNGNLRRERSTINFNVEAGLGLRRVVNDTAEFGDKRFKGDPNYFVVRAGTEVVRNLPRSWQIATRLSGQFTATPLVSNEQIALGGVDTVRGYLESSQLADYGFNGSLELRNGWLAKPLRLPPGSAYLFAFYDAGVGAILEPLPSQASTFDLASWGLGLRVDGWHGFALAFDWAHAFTNSGSILAGDERTHFSFRYAF